MDIKLPQMIEVSAGRQLFWYNVVYVKHLHSGRESGVLVDARERRPR